MPPLPPEKWDQSRRHPVGVDFVAEIIKDQLILWAGSQRQPNGSLTDLPANKVYSCQFSSQLLNQKRNLKPKWNKMEAKGQIHPGSKKAASVSFKHSIYIFGGEDGNGNSTRALTILSFKGFFQKLKPRWEAPWPRHEHRGWSHEERLYFLGGRVKTTKEEIEHEGISANFEIRRPRKKGDPVTFYTNQLLQYDPVGNVISTVETSGSIPCPRSDFAIATLEKGKRVIIHGGYCGEVLSDLFELDMKTRVWTKLSFFEQSLSFHILVPISAAEVLIYGGNPLPANSISNELWILDLEQKRKKPHKIESQDLDIETPFAGMKGHRAVVQKKERGAFVFCLGGYADKGLESHPDHMVVFEVFHTN